MTYKKRVGSKLNSHYSTVLIL